MTDTEKSDPASFAQPRYWIKENDKETALEGRTTKQWLIGFRGITNATNERSFISSVIPSVGVGNSMPVIHSSHSSYLQAALIGNFSSLCLDFVVRQKIGGTNLNFFIVKQFPVLPPNTYKQHDFDFIVPRVLELAYTAYDLTPFARDLGFGGRPFNWNSERRALLRAELDAYYAKLYGLTRDELRYILSPADVYGVDYPTETFRGLENNETRHFGDYRTRRLVLEAWDQLAGY